MSYYESAEGCHLTIGGIVSILNQHGISMEEFRQDHPDVVEIDAQELLRWIGY